MDKQDVLKSLEKLKISPYRKKIEQYYLNKAYKKEIVRKLLSLRDSISSVEGTKETNQVLTSYFIMFILFRIFDIVKPYPINYYDKNFKNSFGVIMDDVCAGLYVVAVLVLYMVLST